MCRVQDRPTLEEGAKNAREAEENSDWNSGPQRSFHSINDALIPTCWLAHVSTNKDQVSSGWQAGFGVGSSGGNVTVSRVDLLPIWIGQMLAALASGLAHQCKSGDSYKFWTEVTNPSNEQKHAATLPWGRNVIYSHSSPSLYRISPNQFCCCSPFSFFSESKPVFILQKLLLVPSVSFPSPSGTLVHLTAPEVKEQPRKQVFPTYCQRGNLPLKWPPDAQD